MAKNHQIAKTQPDLSHEKQGLAQDNPEPSATGRFAAFASFPDKCPTPSLEKGRQCRPNNFPQLCMQKALENSTTLLQRKLADIQESFR